MRSEWKERAAAQEEQWRAYINDLATGPLPAFDEQWQRFNAVYAERPESAGPPPAWWPLRDRRSNIAALCEQLGLSDYAALYDFSVTQRGSFWEAVLDRLGMRYEVSPERVLDMSRGPEHPRWLPGARLNAVDTCFRWPGDQTALVFAREGDETLSRVSFAELEALTNRVASGLRAAGFEPGQRVALYMPMTLECVAAYLGAVRAGLAVISVADSFAAGELARRLRIGEADGVIANDAYARGGRRIALYDKVREAEAPRTIVIPEPGAAAPVLREGDLLWEDMLGEDGFASHIAEPEHITNVLFSSGTTGDPKAIPWTQLTPIKAAMDGHLHHDIQPGDVVAWPTNIGWMMGPWLIYASLYNGAAIALYEGLPSGEGFSAFVRDAGVTMLGVIPSLVRAWRNADCVGDDDWEGIRAFSSTGEPSNREDYLWLMSRSRYRAPVIEYCGGTEIGGGYITGTVEQPASPATFTTASLGLGMHILDAEAAPVGEGEMGEIFLVPPSIGLSQTLLNRDHHEVYFAGCPKGPQGELLRRHGDEITRLHGGFFRAQGRADDTMNLGGIKVSSMELERVVAGHPAVYESAAIAVQPGGEGAEALVLYVVPASEQQPDAETLRGELRKRIAGELNPLFKIHDLVFTDALPRTASNKVMRRKLRTAWSEKDHG